MPCLRAPRGYRLDATLLPSFTLPLFRYERGAFRKEHGWSAGSILWQDGDLVCCEGCGVEELIAWSGLWATRRGEKLRVTIGLSVSPWDYHLVFASVFLSQNTSYQRVIRWMRVLAPLLEEWRIEDARRVAEGLRSYQARRLPDALEKLPWAFRAASLWERRSRLLAIPSVGVKVAHATLLFTSFSGYPIPVDRHLKRRVAGAEPRPRLCARYPCPKCPLREQCIAWRLYRRYGVHAGVYQTLVWLESQEPRSLARLLHLLAELL